MSKQSCSDIQLSSKDGLNIYEPKTQKMASVYTKVIPTIQTSYELFPLKDMTNNLTSVIHDF